MIFKTREERIESLKRKVERVEKKSKLQEEELLLRMRLKELNSNSFVNRITNKITSSSDKFLKSATKMDDGFNFNTKSKRKLRKQDDDYALF